jgi:hypothetical protein
MFSGDSTWGLSREVIGSWDIACVTTVLTGMFVVILVLDLMNTKGKR